MKIDRPGIYMDFPSSDYFSDPSPRPSLTQSVAKILLEKSPLHAWHAHPRLNPDYRHDDDTKYDVGNIAHAMLIGRGKSVVLVEGYDDWRTEAAKEQREAAAAEGKIAVLGKHYALADRMVTAAREQLDMRGLGNLFTDGNGEVVLAWREDDIWLRQMVDWLTPDLRTFADYKTVGESAAPQVIPRKMVNDGWPIQAAMAERGLETLDPWNAGRRRYLFVVQETEKPYALNVVELTEAVMTIGRKQLDFAVNMWRECMVADRWPGYPIDILTPQYPNFSEVQWLEREIEHADRRKRDLLESLMGG